MTPYRAEKKPDSSASNDSVPYASLLDFAEELLPQKKQPPKRKKPEVPPVAR